MAGGRVPNAPKELGARPPVGRSLRHLCASRPSRGGDRVSNPKTLERTVHTLERMTHSLAPATELDADDTRDELSDYEKKRNRNIAENKKQLKELGLEDFKPQPRRNSRKASVANQQGTRTSKRLREASPPVADDCAARATPSGVSDASEDPSSLNLHVGIDEETTVFGSGDIPCPFLLSELTNDRKHDKSFVSGLRETLFPDVAMDFSKKSGFETIEHNGESYIGFTGSVDPERVMVAVWVNSSDDLFNLVLIFAGMLEATHSTTNLWMQTMRNLKELVVDECSRKHPVLDSALKGLRKELESRQKEQHEHESKHQAAPPPSSELDVRGMEAMLEARNLADEAVERIRTDVKLKCEEYKHNLENMKQAVASKKEQIVCLMEELKSLRDRRSV